MCNQSTEAGPLADRGPFDVMVAGQLVEHAPNLSMLFRAAHLLLAPGGQLFSTTPYPWAPHRVRAGKRGECFKNPDHIVFAMPSGAAELAERARLCLSEAATTAPPARPAPLLGGVKRAVAQRLRGSSWVRAGYGKQGANRTIVISSAGLRPNWAAILGCASLASPSSPACIARSSTPRSDDS